MAALPPRVFQTLLSTLQFGVGATGDDEVTQVRAPLAPLSCPDSSPCAGTTCQDASWTCMPLHPVCHAVSAIQRPVEGEVGVTCPGPFLSFIYSL